MTETKTTPTNHEGDQPMTTTKHHATDSPPVAYRYMKENFNRAAMGADVIECLDLEATHHVHTGLTEDHRNAARAFVEKQQPVFSGR